MDAREYLDRLRNLDSQIEGLVRQHDEYIEKLSLLRSMDYARDKVQTSPGHGASYEQTVDKVVDSEAEIVRLIDELVDLKREAEGYISMMEDATEQMILRYRYLQAMTFESVADALHYTRRHIFRLHDTALESFQQVLDKEKAAQ